MRNHTDWPDRFARLQVKARDERLRAYYAEGICPADTPISEVPLIAMDFETTGLDAQEDAIVSIGLMPFSLQRIFCREAAHWVVRPDKPLTEESVVIHRITHSEVMAAPDLKDVLADFLRSLAGRVAVVHYRRIERDFLATAMKHRLGEILEFPLIDTMELELRALRKRQGLFGRLMRQPLGSLRLGDCRQRYSLPHYGAHHALTDALATAELLQAQVAYHYSPSSTLGQLWI
jgi:DNA polymerase-3 subunit epsilon